MEYRHRIAHFMISLVLGKDVVRRCVGLNTHIVLVVWVRKSRLSDKKDVVERTALTRAVNRLEKMLSTNVEISGWRTG